MIEAGNLDRRITILRHTADRDDRNNPRERWLPLATVWASKRDVSDTERLRSAEVAAVITTRFVIRWSNAVSSVNSKDRIELSGVEYGIVGVKEVGRREGIEITASAAADLFRTEAI